MKIASLSELGRVGSRTILQRLENKKYSNIGEVFLLERPGHYAALRLHVRLSRPVRVGGAIHSYRTIFEGHPVGQRKCKFRASVLTKERSDEDKESNLLRMRVVGEMYWL